MDGRYSMGILLVIAGLVLVFAGLVVLFIDKIPIIGRLPGDINIYGKNWSFHFPVVTGLIISLILTIIINILFRR
ncbi:DUF2905 domain-containing protein [bacterium]|nr:DUF2905 domain-containing protein [bacterium]